MVSVGIRSASGCCSTVRDRHNDRLRYADGRGLVDFARLQDRFAFVFLIGALGLSVLLLVFGSGPGRSGVKVNLLGVQPVEAIRPLIALFLAGYFARRWEWLRELAESLARQHPILNRLHLPRIADLIPVAVGMALVLLFFFFQRDLGPALVLACTFLVTYSVRPLGPARAGRHAGQRVHRSLPPRLPVTVVKRIDMWHSPWDNGVNGGDQVAHARGAGLGRTLRRRPVETGPRYIPTGRTIGARQPETWIHSRRALVSCCSARSWSGAAHRAAHRSAMRGALFVGLMRRSPRRRAIVGGLLGLLPLSGVVTPFLSLGRSSMVSNLAVVGLLLAASRQRRRPGKAHLRRLATRAGGLGAARDRGRGAFMVQVWSRGDIADPPDADAAGGRRNAAAGQPALRARWRLVRRGTILDRRGLPIAMDATLDVSAHHGYRARVSPCSTITDCAAPTRAWSHAATAQRRRKARRAVLSTRRQRLHLLGDAVSKASWAAPTRVRGREFDTGCAATGLLGAAGAVGCRDEPFHCPVRAILDRPRDVR